MFAILKQKASFWCGCAAAFLFASWPVFGTVFRLSGLSKFRVLQQLLLSLIFCVPIFANEFESRIEPILIKHCYDCHGDGMDKGEVALDEHQSLSKLFADRSLWEAVYSNIETRLMPPADKPQLADKDVAAVLSWIETEVFKLDPNKPDPGRTVIRRLNRAEYNNAIRDIFAIDLRPADKFPPDDTGYGFDNIGDVLTLSPNLLENYLRASESVVEAVIPTAPPKPLRQSAQSGQFVRRQGGHESGILASHGTVGMRFRPEEAGDYRVVIRARGSQADRKWPIMRVEIEGALRKEVEVNSKTSKDFQFHLKASNDSKSRWIDVSFINDHYDPKAKDSNQRDRNLYVDKIEVMGPIRNRPNQPSANYSYWLREASKLDDEDARARNILGRIARQAWRKPISKSELDGLHGLYSSARKSGESFEQGLQLAMKGILVSQRFLLRGERLMNTGGEKIKWIDEISLASRLSFFLWSSVPDEELLRLAETGNLRKQLNSQIERMLNDKRSRALTENFAGQWLQLRNLDVVSPDPKIYTGWSSDLRRSMR